MKAIVVFEASGRIEAVAIPNPEAFDRLELETQPDQGVLVEDLTRLLPHLSFGSKIGAVDEAVLEEAVQTIASGFRVDLESRTLISIRT